MREMREAGGVRHQATLGEHRGEFALRRQRRAGCGEQDAAFLPGLADGGDAEGSGGVAAGQHGIGGFHPPAREDQRAGGEIDLVMAHDHEDFEPPRPVPQQQDGGGGTGRDRAGHGRIAARPRPGGKAR